MLFIIIFLQVAISYKVGVFQVINVNAIPFIPIVVAIVTNTWVCSIASSIIAVFLIYKWQVWYSKKKLKADFRCNEIIESIYHGIDEFLKFSDRIPSRITLDKDEDCYESMKKNAIKFVEFFQSFRESICLANLAMSYEKNNLLLDSIQSCFLINLNFELLSILNNVKNRFPNIGKKFLAIEEVYEQYEKEPNDDDLLKLGNLLSCYLIDLRFMAEYWRNLFDYLEYDPTYVRLFIDAYESKYSIDEVLQDSVEMREFKIKEIDKIVRKTIFIDRLKGFWIE